MLTYTQPGVRKRSEAKTLLQLTAAWLAKNADSQRFGDYVWGQTKIWRRRDGSEWWFA